jgi:hypothetical protein
LPPPPQMVFRFDQVLGRQKYDASATLYLKISVNARDQRYYASADVLPVSI